MGVETALRRQARGEKRKHGKAEDAARCEQGGRCDGPERDRRKIEDERERAERPALNRAYARPVEARLKPGEPGAHPGDGVANHAIERRRIADQRLKSQSGERKRQRLRKGHDGGADLRG